MIDIPGFPSADHCASNSLGIWNYTFEVFLDIDCGLGFLRRVFYPLVGIAQSGFLASVVVVVFLVESTPAGWGVDVVV